MSEYPSHALSTDRNLADLPTAAWLRFGAAYVDATHRPLPAHLVAEIHAVYPKPAQS